MTFVREHLGTLIGVTALGVAVFALMAEEGVRTPDSPDAPRDGMPRVGELERRLAVLERQPTARGEVGSSSTGSPARAPAGMDSARIEDLEQRVERLEKALAVRPMPSGLAKPGGIPAALAVLLASRGIVTEVGDIEAIRENFDVLADLVRDVKANEWQRIEAYRGLLVFEATAHAKDTLADVAGIVGAAQDPKARKSAADMLAAHMHPGVVGVLTNAFYREGDENVRLTIVERLLQVASDPTAKSVLGQAAESDASPRVREAAQGR